FPPQRENIPLRGRFDSTFAALQSARSRAVSSNRQRRLTGDAQSRAGDQALVQQTYFARSPLGRAKDTDSRRREQLGPPQPVFLRLVTLYEKATTIRPGRIRSWQNAHCDLVQH